MWRSLVVRRSGVPAAVDSNPAVPTNELRYCFESFWWLAPKRRFTVDMGQRCSAGPSNCVPISVLAHPGSSAFAVTPLSAQRRASP